MWRRDFCYVCDTYRTAGRIYGIYTQNHVIDVIAHKEPVIRELGKILDDEKMEEGQHGTE